MTLETGSAGLRYKESPLIQKREQRVHSYMARYNKLPRVSIQEEILGLVQKSKALPIAERDLAHEVTESIRSSVKITPSERVIETYEASVEARRDAEDAFVALLYDLQTPLRGRNMHIIPSDLPRLLRSLENTRMRRPQEYVMDGIMPKSNDQAVLFLTQVYFYDPERIDGKRTITIEGETSDGIEIQKLVQKLNAILPENDRFILSHRKPPTYIGKQKVEDFIKLPPLPSQKSEVHVAQESTFKKPILSAAEKRRKEELEDVLHWSKRHFEFSVSDPNIPIHLDIAPLPKGALGEVFGREGKENIALFSLLSSVSPTAEKTIIEWLLNEKSAAKRRNNAERLCQLSSYLFHEVLSPETKGEFEEAFVQDVLKNDTSMRGLHEIVVEKLLKKAGHNNKKLSEIEKLVVITTERLFLLRQAQIVSQEIGQEVKNRRKALLGGKPVDTEGGTSPQDIDAMIKKIQDIIEFPLDPETPVTPYELNVHFGTGSIANLSHMIARHINGEPVEKELFTEGSEELFEYVVSLGIEKWSHQARHLPYMREKMSVGEVERLGHVLPYELIQTTDEEGKEHLEQSYYIHDNTPSEDDPHRGLLYVDSETGLSIPVVFIPAKREGENMHIEYVYGINASIHGMRIKKANT